MKLLFACLLSRCNHVSHLKATLRGTLIWENWNRTRKRSQDGNLLMDLRLSCKHMCIRKILLAFPREVTIPSESYFPKKENFCKVTFMEVTSNHKIMIHRSLAGERDGGHKGDKTFHSGFNISRGRTFSSGPDEREWSGNQVTMRWSILLSSWW